jgi:hypothetical protein
MKTYGGIGGIDSLFMTSAQVTLKVLQFMICGVLSPGSRKVPVCYVDKLAENILNIHMILFCISM